MSARGIRALALLAACASGCDSCHREPPRLFLPDAPVAVDAAVDAPIALSDAAAQADAQAIVSGAPAGDGSTIELDGVSVRAPAGSRFTQMLALDPDGDGDRDLVVTLGRVDGAVQGVAFYRRSPAGFERVPLPDAGPAAETTSPAVPLQAQLRSTSPRTVVAVFRPSPAPGADGGGAATAARAPLEEDLVVSLAAPAPSVRARIALLAPPTDTVLDAVIVTPDRDGDGRDDIVVSLGARRADERVDHAARAELLWLDRATGLARDTSEPEASFARLGGQLRAMATRRRAQDLPDAVERVVRLRRALCSDAGAPRLRVGSELGVSCANSAGLHAAADALARGYLALGEYPAAIALTRPETASELGEVDPSRVATELRRPGVADALVTLRQGPFVGQSLDAVLLARAPALVLDPPGSPAAALLRGPVTARVDLATLGSAPGAPGNLADVLARSPDGATVLQGFYETCDGVVAALCPTAATACVQGAGPGVLPPGAQLARLTDLASPERAAACLRQGAAAEPVSRAVAARVVGFGAQGLVVAWRGRLLRASSTGRATAIGPGEPLGGPFPPGSSASASGQYAVVATTEGLFVRDGAGHWKQWAPAELAGRYRQLTDLTISNDGQTVVGLLGGQLELFTHPGAIAAVPTPQFVPGAAPPAP